MSGTDSAKLGPVSQALEAEMRELARQRGLLIWLDNDGVYNGFVDGLIERQGRGGFPYPVVAFRGSFLETMLALDGLLDAVDMRPLILHLPGYTEQQVAETPLYELYRAGRTTRRPLTSVTRDAAVGRVAPAAIATMEAAGLRDLEAADTWLAGQLSGETDGGTLPPLALSAISLFDDLVRGGEVAQRWQSFDFHRSSLMKHVERVLGLDASFADGFGFDAQQARVDQLAFLLSSFALCVEFVHDLTRPPRDARLVPLKGLPKALVETACTLAEHLRTQHPTQYERDADELELRLSEEAEHATAADLGKVDTFRFEDRCVFGATVEAVVQGRFQLAADYAATRTEARSFWLRYETPRRTAWQVLRLCAALGVRVQEHAELLSKAHTVEDAVASYASGGYQVDRAQRELEQASQLLPTTGRAEFPALRLCLEKTRHTYRAWADAQALAFNTLCRKRGFLPEAELQQRSLFDQVVKPATDRAITAYFVVDGLRFEMASVLREAMAKESGTELDLKPRLAELPTLTEVGMNLLAPLAREGRLQPELRKESLCGFRVGEARVFDPKTRRKAMHERVGRETCPWLGLEEVLDREVPSLRQTIAQARLVVVHAEGIDKAGEKGVGLRHFEDELRRLRAAWMRLREAGVKQFVITADHGFLLQDETTRVPLAHGRKTDPKRRHVISTVAADHPGEIRAAARELGYEGLDVHFMFPENTMPFDTGERTKDFLHGGNSLQERVIPVLTIRHRHAPGAETARYAVEQVEVLAPVMGMHRIKATVVQLAQTSLNLGGGRRVELRLRAADTSHVNVELLDAPRASLQSGAVVAKVDEPFELLFRLTGPEATRVRVQLEHSTGLLEVEPAVLDQRFAVECDEPGIRTSRPPDPPGKKSGAAQGKATSGKAGDAALEWLEEFDNEGVRKVFGHIQRFGGIDETDATEMLGGPRQFRSFSRRFDDYASRAPFAVHIDTSSGQKRYVKEG